MTARNGNRFAVSAGNRLMMSSLVDLHFTGHVTKCMRHTLNFLVKNKMNGVYYTAAVIAFLDV